MNLILKTSPRRAFTGHACEGSGSIYLSLSVNSQLKKLLVGSTDGNARIYCLDNHHGVQKVNLRVVPPESTSSKMFEIITLCSNINSIINLLLAGTINPYCQMMENSSRIFSEIFIFRVLAEAVLLQNSSIKNHEYLFSV